MLLIIKFFWILLLRPEHKEKLLPLIQKNKGVLQKFAQYLYLQDNKNYNCFKILLDNGMEVKNRYFDTVIADLKKYGVEMQKTVKSGSIGQVYFGVYQKNQKNERDKIVIKKIYPFILKRIKKEIRIMKALVKILCKSFKIPDTMFRYLNAFENILNKETDYINERKNAEKFQRFSFDNILFPELIGELCNDMSIALTECTGVPIEQFMLSAKEQDRLKVINILFNFYADSFFKYNIIHGDPHYGNFFIKELNGDIQVEVIDFGCIGEFSPCFVKGFKSLIKSLREENNSAVYECLLLIGFREAELQKSKQLIIPIMYAVLEPFLNNEPFNFHEWRLAYIINTIMSSQNLTMEFTLSDDMLLLMRVLNGALAYISFLDKPEVNVYGYITNHIKTSM